MSARATFGFAAGVGLVASLGFFPACSDDKGDANGTAAGAGTGGSSGGSIATGGVGAVGGSSGRGGSGGSGGSLGGGTSGSSANAGRGGSVASTGGSGGSGGKGTTAGTAGRPSGQGGTSDGEAGDGTGGTGAPRGGSAGDSPYEIECHGDTVMCGDPTALLCLGLRVGDEVFGYSCSNECQSDDDCSTAPSSAEAQAGCVDFVSKKYCLLVCKDGDQEASCPTGMYCYVYPGAPTGNCLWH